MPEEHADVNGEENSRRFLSSSGVLLLTNEPFLASWRRGFVVGISSEFVVIMLRPIPWDLPEEETSFYGS